MPYDFVLVPTVIDSIRMIGTKKAAGFGHPRLCVRKNIRSVCGQTCLEAIIVIVSAPG
jgi:hypothetical protein